jgi:outer membrane protein assembly factor BamB
MNLFFRDLRISMRFTLLGILILLIGPGTSFAQQQAGSDWTRFLGPLGTSVSTERGIIAPWPDKGLRVVWHTPLGTGYGAPVISKGKLYQFDRVEHQARLQCLDARTGKQLWKFEYPTDYKDFFGYNNGPRCCPIVDRDRVFIHGVEGVLHCLRAGDGELLWKVDTRLDFNLQKNFFGVGSTPVVEGDLLIVQVGGNPKGSVLRSIADIANLKPNGSGVVAFRIADGSVKYRLGDELASYSSPTLATIEGRRWCFVFARGGLLAFEPASGKLDFHFPWRSEDLESVNAANPVVVGNQVLITETYGPGSALLKVKPGGYEMVWNDAKRFRKSLQCHWNTPVYHDGYVYGSSGRHTPNAELRCVELATGKVQWSEPRLGRSSLLMVDGHFICQCEDGTLRLLKVNPHKYEEISRWDCLDPVSGKPLLDYPCWAAPVLSHGFLYVRGNDHLVCVELIRQ